MVRKITTHHILRSHSGCNITYCREMLFFQAYNCKHPIDDDNDDDDNSFCVKK